MVFTDGRLLCSNEIVSLQEMNLIRDVLLIVDGEHKPKRIRHDR